MEIIPANSPTFEIVHINAQRCDCGGRYQIHGQQLLEVDGNPIDRIRTSCERCEEERAFFFAVRGEAADDHFERTEASLRAALDAIHAQDWPLAEAQLRQALDPQHGEPAFCWAHYHLGMVLLAQQRPAEALAFLRQAALLSPNEAEFYRGLAKALTLTGEPELAADVQATYKALQTL